MENEIELKNPEKTTTKANAESYIEEIAIDFLNEKCFYIPEKSLSRSMASFLTGEAGLLITICRELRTILTSQTGKYTAHLRYDQSKTPEKLTKMRLEKISKMTDDNTQEELNKPLGRELFDICMRLCDECANLRMQIEFIIHD